MKVAYLTNQYPKVSHTFIRREIRALETQGWEVARFSIRGAPEQLTDPDDLLEAEQTRLILDGDYAGLAREVSLMALQRPRAFAKAVSLATALARPSDRPKLTEYMYLAEACRLVSWCDAGGIEHVHAHFGTNPAAVTMLARELGGPGYSFTVHGPEEFDRAAVLHLGEKIARARFVVGISEYGKSQLYRYCAHTDWEKVHVVRCGVDGAFFEQAPAPIPEQPTLVCVGRLSEQKGQLLLLDAAYQCQQQGARFKLVFVGDGELRDPIEAKIAKLGLGGSVEITGWASNEIVRNHLAQARALILPSFAEGLPVVIMEAFALGRPVVSTYVAGIPELVENGKNGWLVPSGSVPALSQAILSVLNTSSEVLTQMGLEGRARVEQSHDIQKNAKELGLLFGRYAGT